MVRKRWCSSATLNHDGHQHSWRSLLANSKTQTLYSHNYLMMEQANVPSLHFCSLKRDTVATGYRYGPPLHQDFFEFVVKPWLSCSHKEREGIFCGLNEQLCQSYPPTRKCAKVSRGYPLLQILRHLSYLANTHKSESTSSFQSSQGSLYVGVVYWPQGKAIVWGKWLKISMRNEQRIVR